MRKAPAAGSKKNMEPEGPLLPTNMPTDISPAARARDGYKGDGVLQGPAPTRPFGTVPAGKRMSEAKRSFGNRDGDSGRADFGAQSRGGRTAIPGRLHPRICGYSIMVQKVLAITSPSGRCLAWSGASCCAPRVRPTPLEPRLNAGSRIEKKRKVSRILLEAVQAWAQDSGRNHQYPRGFLFAVRIRCRVRSISRHRRASSAATWWSCH